jgi:asparagine synthase (glutamine-hydrolysing)
LRDLFISNIRKKLNAECEFGFLLSGGLDSSLVCSIGSNIFKESENSPNRIHTFTGGFSVNAPDVIAARLVAKHINSIHTEFIFTPSEGIAILPEVIRNNETWDQTSIRASIIMTLILRAIKKQCPKIKMIFSGELADELFMGYFEWQNAPDKIAARQHVIKRLRDVTYFDGLRADRTISAVGIELRLPFFSKAILEFVLTCPPEYLMPKHEIPGVKPAGIEKYMLRKAFDFKWNNEQEVLPKEVLWRTKHAFSDATSIVGVNSWKEQLKAYADSEITDSRFAARNKIYKYNVWIQTKEDMLYREIFETFGYYANCQPYKWLPAWAPAELTDASATALAGFTEGVASI